MLGSGDRFSILKVSQAEWLLFASSMAEGRFIYSHKSLLRLLDCLVALQIIPYIIAGSRYVQLPISEAGNPSMTISKTHHSNFKFGSPYAVLLYIQVQRSRLNIITRPYRATVLCHQG